MNEKLHHLRPVKTSTESATGFHVHSVKNIRIIASLSSVITPKENIKMGMEAKSFTV